MRPFVRRSLLALSIAAAVLLTGALARNRNPGRAAPRPVSERMSSVSATPVTGEPGGLDIRLSDGSAAPAGRPEGTPDADARPLSEAEVRSLLARLPPIDEAPADRQDVAMPPRSLPPPRAGITRLEPWPPALPAGDIPTPEREALTIVRHAPEGDVPLAARVAVTFSQPMVAIGSHADAERTLPARLTPQPEGAWRWAGSQLLIFEGPEAGRLPMATRYVVEVPAGTASATGNALATAHRFEFATPAPRVLRWEPVGGPQTLDPLMILVFDQRIDPGALHSHVRAEAGGRTLTTRLVDARAPDGDDARRILAFVGDEALLDRVIALRAVEPFPYDASITMSVLAGAPSAEGPLTTTEAQSQGFRTHGRLKLVEHRCGWEQGTTCRPDQPWLLRFSNPLDPDTFDPKLISIEPSVEDLDIGFGGDSIWISGAFAARSSYEVTASAELRDIFDQQLGSAARVTFKTGTAAPRMQSAAGPFIVLDPGAQPEVRVHTAGLRTLKVDLYAVEPEAHWAAFHESLQKRWERPDRKIAPPGRKAHSETLSVAGDPDALTETRVDLSKALESGLGHVIVVINPGETLDELRHQEIVLWAQSTRLGLSAFVEPDRLLAWATDLADGSPAAGVSLTLGPGDISTATSGVQGLASLELARVVVTDSDKSPSQPPGSLTPTEERLRRGNRYLLGRRGEDVAFLPENAQGWWEGTSWRRRPTTSWIAWHVFDDRGLYRPSETARMKGFIRRIEGGKLGDVTLADGQGSVAWRLTDSVGNDVATGSAPLSALGGFDITLTLPAGMNLGHAGVSLSLPDGSGHHHPLRVEEFRRPEYEVTVSSGEGPFLVGAGADVEARAAYFAGGALPGAPVSWNVVASPAAFEPPGWDEFTFGEFLPWWRPVPGGGATRSFTHEGVTDAGGVSRLRLDFLSCLPPRATSVRCEATVQDVNRQAWSDSTTMLVFPSETWIGLKPRKAFVERGDEYDVEFIVTDSEGAVLEGREVILRAARTTSRWIGGTHREEESDVIEERVTSAKAAALASLKLARSGSWKITATVRDDEGRPNETVLLAWVSGAEQVESRTLEQQEVELIPDQQEYRPGDVAKVLVRAPFAPAEALVTLRRSGILSERRLRLDDTGTVIEIPIEEAWIPGAQLQVDLAGKQASGAPAFATGQVMLHVTRRVRELNVDVSALDPVLEPGGSTRLRLRVTDAKGAPVAGEVAVIVADEAVLALTGYQLADPLLAFYPERGADVMDHHLRSHVELGERPSTTADMSGGVTTGKAASAMLQGGRMRGAPPPPSAMAPMAAMEMSADSAASPGPAIALRKDMSALALFEPAVIVGADGIASLDLKLPDSLTRYRVMAVAVSGPKLFGKGESTVTARRGLMVRPSLPRFLNFGDRAELPVVLQNQTGKALDVTVALRVSNASLTAAHGYRVSVPADDRVEVRFPAETNMAGAARVQAVAVSGELSDAAELSLPVWTPATTEAFATYGTLDSGALAQPVVPPSGALPQFGELSLSTSSTALFELGDATLALWRYQFECSEQISSRLLGVLAMRDAVEAFGTLPPKAELQAAIERDLDLLARRQSYSGDVGLWRHPDAERDRWPWVSVHASHAFLFARAKGYRVPEDVHERALMLLRDIESRIPADYPDSCRRVIVAHSLHVRQAHGDPDPAKAMKVFREVPLAQHGLEVLGFLLPTLAGSEASSAEAKAIITHLRNRAAEEAGTISFTENYGDSDWLVMHSARRTDGILLRALIVVEPSSDMLPKLVRGLLEHRVRGSWSTTQDNAFILLAMDRYFAVHEAKAPDFTASAWLGETPLARQEWRGRSTERKLVEVPMREVMSGGARDVVISKEGTGRLYFRLGMTYAPSSLRLDASHHGFVVERSYEGVEDAKDVSRDDDGTWRFQAGALVRSRVTMVATARRTHVALVDPLPAGVEALNPALAMTPQVPSDDSGGNPMPGIPMARSWWWGPWFEHQNLRDQQAEAFTSYLPGGAWEYSWIGRATTPGRFVVPPAKAEEMYHPETFGRGATDTVIVE